MSKLPKIQIINFNNKEIESRVKKTDIYPKLTDLARLVRPKSREDKVINQYFKNTKNFKTFLAFCGKDTLLFNRASLCDSDKKDTPLNGGVSFSNLDELIKLVNDENYIFQEKTNKKTGYGGTYVHPELAILFITNFNPVLGFEFRKQLNNYYMMLSRYPEFLEIYHNAMDDLKALRIKQGKDPNSVNAYRNHNKLIHKLVFGCQPSKWKKLHGEENGWGKAKPQDLMLREILLRDMIHCFHLELDYYQMKEQLERTCAKYRRTLIENDFKPRLF